MSDKKHTLLAGEMMWIPYCKAIALGGSYEAHCAKSCVAIGGETSGDSQGRTERALAGGRIDAAAYRARMEAIEIVSDMYDKGMRTHVLQELDLDDWTKLPNGHMRKDHLKSA